MRPAAEGASGPAWRHAGHAAGRHAGARLTCAPKSPRRLPRGSRPAWAAPPAYARSRQLLHPDQPPRSRASGPAAGRRAIGRLQRHGAGGGQPSGPGMEGGGGAMAPGGGAIAGGGQGQAGACHSRSQYWGQGWGAGVLWPRHVPNQGCVPLGCWAHVRHAGASLGSRAGGRTDFYSRSNAVLVTIYS